MKIIWMINKKNLETILIQIINKLKFSYKNNKV